MSSAVYIYNVLSYSSGGARARVVGIGVLQLLPAVKVWNVSFAYMVQQFPQISSAKRLRENGK